MDDAYEKMMAEFRQGLAGFVEESWDQFVKHCEKDGVENPSAYYFKEWLSQNIHMGK